MFTLHSTVNWTSSPSTINVTPFSTSGVNTNTTKNKLSQIRWSDVFVVGCSRRQYLPDSLQHWLSCASCFSIPIPALRWLHHQIWKQSTFYEYRESTAHLGWKHSDPSWGLTHDITWYIHHKITSNHLLQLNIGENCSMQPFCHFGITSACYVYQKIVIFMISHTNLAFLMISHTNWRMIAWWKRCHPYTLFLLAYLKILAKKIT